MKQIAITVTLLIAVTAAIIATAYTGSIHAAGVLVLLWILAAIWAVRTAEWWQVRSLFAELRRWRSGD